MSLNFCARDFPTITNTAQGRTCGRCMPRVIYIAFVPGKIIIMCSSYVRFSVTRLAADEANTKSLPVVGVIDY